MPNMGFLGRKMEEKAKCGGSLYWYQCYSGTYALIDPISMAHPAKMSPALCFRILQHLQELGLINKGETVQVNRDLLNTLDKLGYKWCDCK